MDVRILSTVNTAVSRASAVDETVEVAPPAAVRRESAAAPVVQVQSDSVQQAGSLGLFMANSSDEGLPRWKVLTALRVYGLNLKQGGERVAEETSGAAVETVAGNEQAVATDAPQPSNGEETLKVVNKTNTEA